MESKKDITASFTAQDSKNISVFKLFQKDSYLLFIYKKSERIISAVYLVSNFFPDSEPLKWQFRTIGVGVISHNLSLTLNPLYRSERFYQLAAELVKLLSLLDISHLAGLISEMNFAILKKELESLLETLNMKGFQPSARADKNSLFDKDFFTVPPDELSPSLSNIVPGGQVAGGASHPWPAQSQQPSDAPIGHSKGHPYLKDKQITIGNDLSGIKDIHARQSSIIELLKTKSNLTIKDFSQIIKGCSTKTIQRELLKLVKIGVLKKEGERRWSRYSIVKV